LFVKITLFAGILALSLVSVACSGTAAQASNTSRQNEVQVASLKKDLKVMESDEIETIVTLKDTAGHWAESAVNFAVDKGWVSGYPDGTFHPESTVTRAEFTKMMVAALNLPIEPKSGGAWYVPYINAAEKAKIIQNGDFPDSKWDKPMTRLEMSTVAVRALGKTNVEPNQWMYLATKNGIISGTAPGQLSPSGVTTRAQAVTVLQRIVTVKDGGKLPVDKYAVAAAEILWHKTNIFTVMPEVFGNPVALPNNKSAGLTVEQHWRTELTVLETKDKNYKGELIALIAIDLADPKDPNRKLLPDMTKAYWNNNSFGAIKASTKPYSKNSWVLYFQTRQVYNKDSKNYSDVPEVPFSIQGITSPDFDSFYAGTKLNSIARIYTDSKSYPAYILPKEGWIQDGRITISIKAPAFANFYSHHNILYEAKGPFPPAK